MMKPVRDTIKGKLLLKYDEKKKVMEIAKNKCVSKIFILEDGSLRIESKEIGK